MDSPGGNRRCNFPKKRKLASPQIPIQDFIGVGFSYKRDQCILRPDVFYTRCRFRSSISQNINGAERERAVLKTCPLSSECETPLIPFRTQMRERVRGPIEHFHGIRPKTKMRIGGHDTEHPFLFGQRDNVIGKVRAAAAEAREPDPANKLKSLRATKSRARLPRDSLVCRPARIAGLWNRRYAGVRPSLLAKCGGPAHLFQLNRN